MPRVPFDATVRSVDGATRIDLAGDIDRAAAAGLDAAYAAAGTGPVLLDFTDVGFINSTGIALIVGVLAKARSDERQVAAFGLSDHYREIFSITRLADFMTIYEDEQEAQHAARGVEHA